MDKTQVLDEISKLECAIDILNNNSVDTQTAKEIIIKRLNKLNQELKLIQYKEETVLRTRVINGKNIEIPTGMHYGERYKYYYINGNLYAIEKGQLDLDGSFHYHGDVWINEENRCVKLMARILGNDRFGDRVFSEAKYYHDNKSFMSYHSDRSIKINGKYKEYIHKIIELIKIENGLENFNVSKSK